MNDCVNRVSPPVLPMAMIWLFGRSFALRLFPASSKGRKAMDVVNTAPMFVCKVSLHKSAGR